MSEYLLTIWLEIHLKIKSGNKMFCQCKNEQNFEQLKPNTNICPVCTGQPGALPTLSYEVLEKTLLLWKTLNCNINLISSFDRKSYFYPDLPMGYQITQLYHPTCTEGQVSFFVDSNYENERTIHIQDAHMENDTAKMIHSGWDALIDFNRAGTPLVEIVSKPDFTNADEVVEFLKELQRIVRYNQISDADMEKWQMRADVNISIRKLESDPLGTRVEMKNMSSFMAIKRAIENEFARQKEFYDKWESFSQQTRWRDDAKGESYMMRSKEEALDYRYFPEPDLPSLNLKKIEDSEWEKILEKIEKSDLSIPYILIKKFKQEFWFNKEYINALISDKEVLDYFLDCVSDKLDPKVVVKWIAGPIAAYMKVNLVWINDLKFDINQFGDFVRIASEWKILDNQMKIVMDEMLANGWNAENIVKLKWFDAPEVNEWELENIARSVIDENPAIVEQYKWGKTTTLGFFVWQVMKKTWWKVNPKVVWEMIEKLLH